MELKVKKFITNHAFLLLLVVILAILVRILPLFIYGAWGNDVGIYYYIVKKMIENKQIYVSPYMGWGSSYNLFPLLYLSAAFAHLLFGVDILNALLIVGPIFGGGCILLIYFIAREIGLSKNISLLSSIILAVMPVHAYQTSHSAPLSVGHFFFLLSFLFYLKSHKNKWFSIPLYLSTFLLIISHHLTTYMYLIAIFLTIFWRGLNLKEIKHLKMDILYLFFSSTITFLYWGAIAKPVYHNFMNGHILSFRLQPIHIIILWYSLVTISLLILFIKRESIKSDLSKKFNNINMTFLFLIGFIIAILSAIIGQMARLHWLSFQFLLWTLPTTFIIGFATIGWFHFKSYLHPWLLAIISSLIISFIFNFHSLIPERHVEYMCEPLALLAAYGIFISTKNIKIVWRRHRQALPVMISALIVANAVSVYPMGEHAANIGEGIPDTTLNAIKWMEGNISKNLTIATDHRIAMLLFAEGFNTTYDKFGKTWYPRKIWEEENWLNCSDELNGRENNQSYGRIYYIIIDDIMKKDGVFTGQDIPIPLTNKSYEKFENEPFILIYRNCTYRNGYIPEKLNKTIDYMDLNNATMMKNVLHWTAIYKIDWNYIEKYGKN